MRTRRETSSTPDPKPKRAVIAGATALVAGAAIVAPTAFAASSDAAAAPLAAPVRAAHDTDAEADSGADLGHITLDQLADELQDLGLELTIAPIHDVDTAEPDPSDPGLDDDGGVGSPAGLLGTFAVDGDDIDTGSATSPEIAAQASEIWQRFVALIPSDQRQMITAFELDAEENGGAYVYANEADPTTWTLGVSRGLGEDLDYVLIHEFGHLLTLQASEVPPAPDADPDACPTHHTGEGCALSGSTMAEFVQRFWPRAQIERLNELYENEDDDGLDRFYDEHRDDFVTDYAATSPAEDLAETFATFVIDDRPTGDTVADQKVELLWNDPDMVELRDQIRSRL